MSTEISKKRSAGRLELLQRARRGDRQALDDLLGAFREYLARVAQTQLRQQIQGKADGSDLAQETLLEAHQHFAGFRGNSEAEFVAWLRTILAGLVANHMRRYLGTQRRNARLERPLEVEKPGEASDTLVRLIANGSTPSEQAMGHEAQRRLDAALQQLPEHYRQVIVLRRIEGRPFAEVAARMGRTVQGAEKLLARALARLQRVMEA
ncbi:MAG TPA: sigma-70 family RNA polymerase sigma factor [Pirellulales bacterium]|jgi:RNA polymerase sigma-70 factor (ECF subfamily)|nr:sigma-70 family RNA polymerase sigma factor [Pirellulales bacterium]